MYMKKINKNIIRAILIIMVIIILAFFMLIFYLKKSVNITQIKDTLNNKIVEQIKTYNNNYHFKDKEIKFAIRGSINLSPSIKPKIIINDFDMKNIQYKDVLLNMNIKKIEIGVDLTSLLNKKIVPTSVNVNGINTYVNYNKLEDFYYKTEKIKKIVKLDDNEVLGVKDKLKSLLTSTDDNQVSAIQDGYKEIEVEEKVKYDIDNSQVRLMLMDLLNNCLDKNKVSTINFSDMFVTIIKDGNIQKEFKNISGVLSVKDGQLNSKINFILNNINGIFDLNFKDDNYIFSLKNNINDSLQLSFNTKDDFFSSNLSTGNIKADLKTNNVNNLIQWLFPVNSKFYYMFDYKKPLQLATTIEKNNDFYNFKSIEIKSEDLQMNASLDLNKKEDDININVDKVNFDEFIVNLSDKNSDVKVENINIFNYDTFDKFIEAIKLKEKKIGKNKKINLSIKNLTKNNKNIKNLNINLVVENGIYKINKFDLNLDNLQVKSSEPQEVEGIFFNNLDITGSNFSDLSMTLNADKLFNLNAFSLNGKVLISDGILYFYNYNLKNEKNETVSLGNFEYSLNNNNNYMAFSAHIKHLDIKTNPKKVNTLKEKFLWLNNITNNVFADITIDDLNYNNHKIKFDAKIHYYPTFFHLYDIKNITVDNVENVTGQFLITLGKKEPIANFTLFIDKIIYEDNLIDNIFDIEKYKNTILETEIDKKLQSKYWVNRLFSLPSFEELNGNLQLKINSLFINNSEIKNLIFKSNISDGVLNVENFRFDGLGGSTEIKGNIDMKKSKNVNLILTDTTYNIEDIFKLFSKKEYDFMKGILGIGGTLKAKGFNPSVFLSSMNFNFKFISNNLFIKKLGLEKLKSDLTNLYRDDSLLANFQAGNVLLDNSGTTFNNVNGSAILASNINNFVVDAQAAGLSNKFVLKIDNSSNNTIIDMVNTSIVMTKVGETNLPLYSLITFKEDFANKAKLVVDTSQIDDYVSKIRKTKGIKEPKKIKYDNLLQNMINSKDEIDVNNGEQNVSNTDNNIQFQEITTGTENIPNTEQSAVNSDVTE